MNIGTLRIRLTEEYLELITYKVALKQIAKSGEGEGWKGENPNAELARYVLKRFEKTEDAE